jgi:murein L,D-transpeptidase YafK
MRFLRVFWFLALALGLAACGGSKFRSYNGTEVTSIVVNKADRKMYLMHGNEVLESYKIKLGGNPIGHKQFEGDGKTPEGAYFINYKNPKSEFHLSIKISYPNAVDRAKAAAMGKQPGGDIFIHGGPNQKVGRKDWTAGCIAVTDQQMEAIYAMVKTGTPIFIHP